MAQWKGLDQLQKLQERLQTMPKQLGQRVCDSVVIKTPRRTGTLANSWQVAENPTGVVVGNTQPYAPYVENGTHEHAPVGMLRCTILEIPGMVSDILKQ